MPRKRHSPEQILRKLREVEVALAKGETVVRAVRQIAVTEQTYYRWRNEYGGLSIDQSRKLKKLELENARLKRAVADLTLDKLILNGKPGLGIELDMDAVKGALHPDWVV